MDVSSAALSSALVLFSRTILLVDVSSDLHPFFTHRLDAGPIRLATIAHAFNYRVVVLRDGVKSAAPVKRRDDRHFMGTAGGCHVSESVYTRWCLHALEVPAFRQNIVHLRGVSPDVQLACEPWGM